MNETDYSRFEAKGISLFDQFEIKILFGVIMCALCFITTVGNICVIYRYRKASFVGNLFIISLAVADLIVGCFVMPLAGIYAMKSIWTLSLPVCQIWLSADYIASTASILNLLTLSLDRYWSITAPLKYLGKRTKTRALIMISLAWSLSLLWVFPVTGWPYFFNNGIRYIPADKCNTEYNKNLYFKVSTAILNFYIPLITMICVNTKVYLVIRKRYQSPIMKYTSNSSSSFKYRNTKFRSIELNSPVSQNQNDSINKLFDNSGYSNFNKSHKFSGKSINSYELEQVKLQSTSDNYKNKRNMIKSASENQIPSSLNDKNSLSKNEKVSNSTANKIGLKRSSVIFKNRASIQRHMDSSHSDHDGISNQVRNQTKDKNKLPQRSASSFLFSTEKKIKNSVWFANNQFRKGFMNKQEKAFKQLSAIVIGFTICFLPYFIVYLIVALCENCVSDKVFTFTVWLGYVNSTINPFLYALSNKKEFLRRNKAKKELIM